VRGTDGSKFAADNFRGSSQPVAKMTLAKNGGAFEQFRNRRVVSRLETSQRDVAAESLRLFRRSQPPQSFVHAPVQFRQLSAVVGCARPNHALFSLAGKKSDAASGKLQGRGCGTHCGDRIFQRSKLFRRHVAEKFQRDVKLRRLRPADCARRRVALQLALHAADFLPHVRRNGDGDEQAQKRR